MSAKWLLINQRERVWFWGPLKGSLQLTLRQRDQRFLSGAAQFRKSLKDTAEGWWTVWTVCPKAKPPYCLVQKNKLGELKTGLSAFFWMSANTMEGPKPTTPSVSMPSDCPIHLWHSVTSPSVPTQDSTNQSVTRTIHRFLIRNHPLTRQECWCMMIPQNPELHLVTYFNVQQKGLLTRLYNIFALQLQCGYSKDREAYVKWRSVTGYELRSVSQRDFRLVCGVRPVLILLFD